MDLDAEFARFEAEIASVAAETQHAPADQPSGSSVPTEQQRPAAPLRAPPQPAAAPVLPSATLAAPPLAPPPLAPLPAPVMRPPAPAVPRGGPPSTAGMPQLPAIARGPAAFQQPQPGYGGTPTLQHHAFQGAVPSAMPLPVAPPVPRPVVPVPQPPGAPTAGASISGRPPVAVGGAPTDEATLHKLKADLLQGPQDKKDAQKKEGALRQAAGQRWWDPTLGDWPENDFRIFVGDMGNEVNDELLSKAFSKYPSFAKAKIVRDKRTNKSKGFGFVSFLDSEDMVKALREMDGKYIGNRPCKLSKSTWDERAAKPAGGKRKATPGAGKGPRGGAPGTNNVYVPPKRNKKYHIPLSVK